MPIREFQCSGCGHVFESLVFGDSDVEELVCPECGKRELTVLFSVFGVAGTEKKVSSSGSCASCATHTCSTCSSGG